MEYSQLEGGPLSGGQIGDRVRNLLGQGDNEEADVGQGPLRGGQIGGRVRSMLGASQGPDMGQGLGDLEVPSNPGPAAAGRTPLVGTVRRSMGAPVLRDNLGGMGSQ